MNSQYFLTPSDFFLNSNWIGSGIRFTKKSKSLEMSIPLKCKEFVSYTVDFADANDRAGSLLIISFLIKVGQRKPRISFRHTLENFSNQNLKCI